MNLTKRHTAVSSGASFRRLLRLAGLSYFYSSIPLSRPTLPHDNDLRFARDARRNLLAVFKAHVSEALIVRHYSCMTEFFRCHRNERVFTLALAQTHARNTASNCSRRNIHETYRIRKF